jgi:hypothetical protein|tara:strand:- start:45 stop:1139 length:1095 start_codon:yes stop_codon:yes gene_type:complete
MKIINQPQFLSKEAYDDELDLYLQNAEGSEGLVSILTMGSVGAPGLSDLDLICVVKEGVKAKTVHGLDIPGDAQERGILLHGPIVIPKLLFPDLHYIFPVSNLIDCSGESLLQNISPVSEEEEKSLALAYLVDFTLSRLLQHSVVKTKKVIDKRGWLTRLWSLTHSEELCKKAGIDLQPNWKVLLQDIRQTRDDWNSGKSCDDQKFLNMYKRLELVHQQLFTVALEAESKILGKNNSENNLKFLKSSRNIICQSIATPKVLNHGTLLSSVLKINYQTVHAPSQYAVRLAHYGFQGPERIELSATFHGQVLQKRASLVRKYNQFLENSGITFSLQGNLGLPVKKESFVFSFIHKLFWMTQKLRFS